MSRPASSSINRPVESSAPSASSSPPPPPPPPRESHPSKLYFTYGGSNSSSSTPPRPLKPRAGQHPLVTQLDAANAAAAAAKINKQQHAIVPTIASKPTPTRQPSAVNVAATAATTKHTVPSSSSSVSIPPPLPSSTRTKQIPPLPSPPPAVAPTPSTASASSFSSAASHDAPRNTRPPKPNSYDAINPSSALASIPHAAASSSSSSSSSSSASLLPPSVSSLLLDRLQSARVRVASMSLDARACSFLRRRSLLHWRSRMQVQRLQWKEKIRREIQTKFLRKKNALARFRRACNGGAPILNQSIAAASPDQLSSHSLSLRPSQRRLLLLSLHTRAVEFEQSLCKRRATQRWIRYAIAFSHYKNAQARIRDSQLRSLLACAWNHWVDRARQVEKNEEKAESFLLTQHDPQLVRSAFALWRSAQESSSLLRFQSGVARKNAYKNLQIRLVQRWKQATGQARERERILNAQLKKRAQRERMKAWESWRRILYRQRVLATLLTKLAQRNDRLSLRAALTQWNSTTATLRLESILASRADSFFLSRSLIRSLLSWRRFVRLSLAIRLRGQTHYLLLQNSWRKWFCALVQQKREQKRASVAREQREWTLKRCAIDKWKKHLRRNIATQSFNEAAEEFFASHSCKKLLQRWRTNSSASASRSTLKEESLALLHRNRSTFALRALSRCVIRSSQHALHRRVLLQHSKNKAVERWRNFAQEAANKERKRRAAKRFRFLFLLRQSFLLWRTRNKQTKQRETNMMNERGVTNLISTRIRTIWKVWSAIASRSRSERRKELVALLFDSTALRAQAFRLWRNTFVARRTERKQLFLSLHHARCALLQRCMVSWRDYSASKRDARRRWKEGVQWVERRSRENQVRKSFGQWMQRCGARQRARERTEQAQLFHARSLLFRCYVLWQNRLKSQREWKTRIELFEQRTQLKKLRPILTHWFALLLLRRVALRKHLFALSFWSQQRLKRAWKGWMKFLSLRRGKKDLYRRALEHRRLTLQQFGLRCWVVSGLDLNESEAAVAQRENPTQFNSIKQRINVWKYARVWREKTKKRREDDAKNGAMIQRRIVHHLPLYSNSSSFSLSTHTAAARINSSVLFPPQHRPRPLASDTLWEEYKTQLLSSASSASSSSSAAAAASASEFFPPLPPSQRPPPRIPPDFDNLCNLIQFPIQLPLQPITREAAREIKRNSAIEREEIREQQPYAAPFVQSTNDTSSSLPSISVLLSPSLVDPTPAAASVSSDPLVALEDHLTRLMSWKLESKQRRTQLQQMTQHIQTLQQHNQHVSTSEQQQYQLLQQAVLKDQELQPYYVEEAKQLQQRIQDACNEQQFK